VTVVKWYDGCTLRPLGQEPTPRGGCAWCGDPLPKRARRWCTAHRFTYAENHSWTWAREAIKREASVADVVPAAPYLVHGPYGCSRCGRVVDRIEVNHRVPILGRHDEAGCHHHLDGLEALCRECHRQETAAQRARGWTAPDISPQQLVIPTAVG
jgi:5-methylcytosine-specific restriction endonuclease McrA